MRYWRCVSMLKPASHNMILKGAQQSVPTWSAQQAPPYFITCTLHHCRWYQQASLNPFADLQFLASSCHAQHLHRAYQAVAIRLT